jgi:hypothetical protein
MRFTSDRQRKAVMARLNRFSNGRGVNEPLWEAVEDLRQDTIAPTIRGFTGSEILTREGNYPMVSMPGPGINKETVEYIGAPVSDTLILAGKGYKGVEDSPFGLEMDIRREKDEGDIKSGSSDVYKYASGEREKGYPVYSHVNDKFAKSKSKYISLDSNIEPVESIPDWITSPAKQPIQELAREIPKLEELAEYGKAVEQKSDIPIIVVETPDIIKQSDDFIAQYAKTLLPEKKIVGATAVEDEYAIGGGPAKLIVRNRVLKGLD